MKSSSSGIFGALVVAVPLTLFGLAMLVATTLKETPIFWRNAGGYPVELRALVLAAFYPAYFIYFFWLLFGTFMAWRLLRTFKRAGTVFLMACMANWMMLAVSTTIVIWNNVQNLLEGLPFHYHP